MDNCISIKDELYRYNTAEMCLCSKIRKKTVSYFYTEISLRSQVYAILRQKNQPTQAKLTNILLITKGYYKLITKGARDTLCG